MGIGRNLLKKMAFACAARPKLHQIVVPLHKWNHAQDQRVSLAIAQFAGLNADGSEQKAFPFLGGERLAGLGQGVQHIALGKLNFT